MLDVHALGVAAAGSPEGCVVAAADADGGRRWARSGFGRRRAASRDRHVAPPRFGPGNIEYDVSGLISGLSSGNRYHWRFRIKGKSPQFPWSRWFYPPGNGATEMDLRTP
jgi:hypothetical protein